MPNLISMSLTRTGSVQIKPIGYLAGDFHAYLDCCAGARFEPTTKSQIATIEQAAQIASRLQAKGFEIEFDAAVAASLKAQIERTHAAVAAATDRVDETDAALKARDLGLYGFQRTGVRWLASRDRALLADEMGLGKTIQALIAVPSDAAVLVICPAVAKGVWLREAARWRPDLKAVSLSGRGSFRWPARGEMVIVNYDLLPEAPKEPKKDPWAALQGKPAAERPKADAPADITMICDEAHAIKNSKAKRTRAVRHLSEGVRAHGGRVWLLTATPLLNRPQELWSVLEGADLAREAFGSWKRFVVLFNGSPGKWGGYEWGTPSREVGPAVAKVMVRRMRTEVLPDLPTKTWQNVTVEIDRGTRRICDDIMEMIDGPAENILDMAIEFERISEMRAALAKAKIPAMLEEIESYEEQDEPVVVFSAHRTPIDELASREGWAVITGDTSHEKRSEIEAAFQAGKLKGIAATIQAGGVAITLTKAAHALFVDLQWTPALNAQAEDRICRIGQDRGCVVKTLVADHDLDRRVIAKLREKQTLIDGSIEQGRTKKGSEPEVKVAEIKITEVVDAADAVYAAEERAAIIEANGVTVSESPKPRQSAQYQQARSGNPRRAPQSRQEVWAAAALVTLAGLDGDRALVQNLIGFNKLDGDVGHSLASQVGRGLTEKQWKLAILVCGKYHRQVGHCPQ